MIVPLGATHITITGACTNGYVLVVSYCLR